MDETTLFDRVGKPVAYIDWNDDGTIYSFPGEPLGYIDASGSIFGFNGKHLGWFENEVIWDHHGGKAGFTEATCPVFTQFEPFKGFKQFKPFRSFTQFEPFRPFKGLAYSRVSLERLLRAGRN